MDIIDIAAAEIGTKEIPDNSNKVKYNEWYYGESVSGAQYPWCAVFVSWVYFMANKQLPKIDSIKGFASCQNAYNHFFKSGEIVHKENVLTGDIILFDWEMNGHCDHTGIFVKDLQDGTFESIEGNTGLHNASNGGEVMRMIRKYSCVKAFVHPKFLNN